MWVIRLLSILTFMSCMSAALIAPFFPLLVKEKGVDMVYTGFVIGSNSICFIICSMCMSWLMRHFSRETLVVAGIFLQVIQMVMLASLPLIETGSTFLALSFLSQMASGVGSGLIVVSRVSLVLLYSKKEDQAKNIGEIEMMTGLGFIMGPLFGSVTVWYGGFSFPFALVAVIYAILMPTISIGLHRARTQFAPEPEEAVIHEKPISISDLLCIKRYSFALFT